MSTIEAKVVLLGATSVGKTCIVTRATSNFFDPEQVSTVGASFSAKTLQIDDTTVTLRIWDTAGQERFRALAPMYYQGSQAAIIVFSLDSTDSFEDANQWVDELGPHFDQMPLLYLVGNKADLVDNRTVKLEEAQERADKMGALYFETSAKTGQNIDELFASIAERIKSAEKPVDPNPDVNFPGGSTSSGKKKCC
ncbi:small GTP-binding protein, putative [Trichomonas vaginalis G3]|uniref:Small GTP-binding protein, putative n=1 Tax=Trichomonas vaginalis (strain ATCC PRA-98 / G3) TaxID=412133 RepID=A2E0I5_TRIV3|nr:GTPase protein [Trichomonas vaginalis G3]EAY13865.1 small GTP-binding protein, putative [Trichomonas vaginalis G3]KAI5520433.1 GTPase protein [Trichomonas vaginalis G3]|eukprot:XP_001326088.1 small GTP-binding protein [Trichomonas vaginalis G3]